MIHIYIYISRKLVYRDKQFRTCWKD